MSLKRFIRPNKELATLGQLMMPVAVYLALTSNAEWYWWLISLFFYALYLCIGNNLAMHRYFCHNHFEVSKPVECLFVWTSAMSMMGSPVSWPTTHLHHHIHYDTDRDLHGPVIGIQTLLFYFYGGTEIDERVFKSKRFNDLAERYGWLHNNYWYFILFNAVLLLLLGWKVLLFCWLLPATISLWVISFAIYIQHWPKGGASNNTYYTFIGLGETLHLNHHLKPGTSNTAFKAGEIDYMHWIAKLFAKKFNGSN